MNKFWQEVLEHLRKLRREVHRENSTLTLDKIKKELEIIKAGNNNEINKTQESLKSIRSIPKEKQGQQEQNASFYHSTLLNDFFDAKRILEQQIEKYSTTHSLKENPRGASIDFIEETIELLFPGEPKRLHKDNIEALLTILSTPSPTIDLPSFFRPIMFTPGSISQIIKNFDPNKYEIKNVLTHLKKLYNINTEVIKEGRYKSKNTDVLEDNIKALEKALTDRSWLTKGGPSDGKKKKKKRGADAVGFDTDGALETLDKSGQRGSLLSPESPSTDDTDNKSQHQSLVFNRSEKPFYQHEYVQEAVVSCTVFADAMVKNSGIYRALHSPEIAKMARNIHHKGIHKATFDLAKKMHQQPNTSPSVNTIRHVANNQAAKSRTVNSPVEAKFGKLKRGLQNTASQSPKKIDLHGAGRRAASPAASKMGVYRGSGSGPYRGLIYPGWNALGCK